MFDYQIIFFVIINILVILPGYLLSFLIRFRKFSFSGRIFLGLLISISLVLFSGYVLAGLGIFTFYYQFSLLIFYNLFVAFLFFYKKRKENFEFVKCCTFNLKELYPIIIFIIIFILGLIYSSSIFVIGYDRAVHFSRSVDLFNSAAFPDHHPGTSYSPFYPFGAYIVMTFLSSIVHYFSSVISLASPSLLGVDGLQSFGFIFNLYFTFFTSILVLGIYFILECFDYSPNKKKVASIFYLFLCSIYLVEGSIGAVLGLLFFAGVVGIVSTFNYGRNSEWFEDFSLVLFVASSFLLHLISLVSLFLLFIFILFHRGGKYVKKVFFILILSIFISFSLIYLFFPLYLQGTIDNFDRRTVDPSFDAYGLDNLSKVFFANLNNIFLFPQPTHLFILLSILGLGILIKRDSKFLLFALISTAIFAVVPIIALPKTATYLILALSICSTLAFFEIRKSYSKPFLVFLTFLLVVTIIISSITFLSSKSIAHNYVKDSDYLEMQELANILNSNYSNVSFVLPDRSGVRATLFDSLSENKVLFANPQYWDDLQEIFERSKIYTLFNIGGKDIVTNISCLEVREILQRFDIDFVISIDKATINSDCFNFVESIRTSDGARYDLSAIKD